MRRLSLLVLVAASGSCDGSGTSNPADAGVCSCRAIDVSFDRSSSTLGAMNLQDAVDELAARPIAEDPVGSRISTLVQVFPNPGTMGGVTQTLSCADPQHDVALGGACSGGGTSAQLRETRVNNDTNVASYTCGWSQPTGGSEAMRVTVVCLTQAR